MSNPTPSANTNPTHHDASDQPPDIEDMTMGELQAAVDQIDNNIDEAFGQAADTIWSFATSVTGKVTSAVRDGQPGLESLRRNVTDRLAPLDQASRDFTAQIGALAPDENALANITGSMKSVAESVQRNAEAMEAAILAKANESLPPSDESAAQTHAIDRNLELMSAESAMGVLPVAAVSENLDVNNEIAKMGETISNSIVGQTVGDLWSGLWQTANDDDDDDEQQQTPVAPVPKTRFEKRIFELQANPDTYCEPAKDLDAFEQWGKSFNLDDYVESCIQVLDTHDSIAELYERVVPRIVDEDTFWMRYYFAKHVLEKEEERRQKLLERAENVVGEDDNDDGWGDDDWEVDNDVQVATDGASVPVPSLEPDENAGESEQITSASANPVVEQNAATADAAEQEAATAGSTVDEKQNMQTEKTEKKEVPSESKEDVATTVEFKEDDDWEDDDWE